MTLSRILAAAIVLAGVCTTVSRPSAAAEVIVIQTDTYDELNNQSIDVDIGLGFNLGPDGDIRCNYLLNGPIEVGDLDRLKKAIPHGNNRKLNETPRLCLNSAGGAYPEGIAIAKWLIEENVGTAVPANAICYSSCSLIFMGGTFPWKGEINRFLHVKGDVGFHAPYFKVDGEHTFNSGHIAEAFSMGVSGIRELMTIGVGNKVQRFPPELMAEMLAKGPNEVFSIDTIGKAIRFRVHLYGLKADTNITKDAHCNVCVNMNYDANERSGRGAEEDLCKFDNEIEQKSFPDGKRMISGLAPRAGTCAIDVESKNGKLTSWTFVDADAEWKDGLELAFWYLYSPNTKIAELYDDKPDTALVKADGSHLYFEPPQQQGRDIGAELVDFIKSKYLGSGRVDHFIDEGALADEVEYYDKGKITRAAVLHDNKAYYQKWPERLYDMIDDSLQLKVVDDTTVDATFRYNFHLRKDTRQVSGVGETQLRIVLKDGRFQIAGENGRVVSNN